MMSYWVEGPTAVSINEICKRAGVSKPGVYREFGNEDGLKHAALSTYSGLLIAQFQPVMKTEQPFAQTVELLIDITLQERSEKGLPPGCLLVASTNCVDHLGVQTSIKVRETREFIIANYELLVDRAKTRGEFKAVVSTRRAALYINEQINNAMLQQKRGEDADDIRAILKLALSVFV